MSIINVNPKNWVDGDSGVDIIQVDSDASTERDALLEIHDWSAEHQFVPVSGQLPRRIVRADGRQVFRAACYRMTEEERHSIDAASERHQTALSQMPRTLHRVGDYR